MNPINNQSVSIPPDSIKVNSNQSFLNKSEAIKAKLTEFLKYSPTSSNNSTPISPEEMEANVNKGEQLAKKIMNGTLEAIDYNRDGVKNLMWFLTAKVAQQDKLYIGGAMRIDDPDGKIRKFIEKAGATSVYPRISTHMKENVLTGKPQKGLDLRDMGLPAGKHTILFAKQNDKTLYIKMEESGCPPFWKTGFVSKQNFTEYARHSFQYIKTRIYKHTNDGLASRKEHVNKADKQEFKNAMDVLFPTKKQNFFEKLGQLFKPKTEEMIEAKKIKQRKVTALKEGKKLGLSKMHEILALRFEEIASTRYSALEHLYKERGVNSNYITQLKSTNTMLLGVKSVFEGIQEKVDAHKELGYEGNIKGDEVTIPSFETHFGKTRS